MHQHERACDGAAIALLCSSDGHIRDKITTLAGTRYAYQCNVGIGKPDLSGSINRVAVADNDDNWTLIEHVRVMATGVKSRNDWKVIDWISSGWKLGGKERGG